MTQTRGTMPSAYDNVKKTPKPAPKGGKKG